MAAVVKSVAMSICIERDKHAEHHTSGPVASKRPDNAKYRKVFSMQYVQMGLIS
jgi:hypothetical protein